MLRVESYVCVQVGERSSLIKLSYICVASGFIVVQASGLNDAEKLSEV